MLLLPFSMPLICNFPVESPTALPQKPRGRVRLACGEVQRTIDASRGKPRPRHSSAGHLRWWTQPLGHGSPPFRRDTEVHRKSQCQFEAQAREHFSSLFRGIQCPAKRASASGGGDATHRIGAGVGGCVLARKSARDAPGAGAAPRRHPLPWLAARPPYQFP